MNKITIGKSTLINMDCMEFMATLPDNYYELAICDPPYGIGENGDRNSSRGKLAIAKDYKAFSGNDAAPPDKNYFLELTRVSKNQIIWGANHFANNLPNPSSSCWIVWDKNKSGDFADAELAYASFKTAVRIFKFTWNGMMQGDMKNKEYRIHPTQKPVKLYEWLITSYAKQGDKILDTHGGSFSSAIACNNLGFEFTGIELDADYFDSAVKRVTAANQQIRMFA